MRLTCPNCDAQYEVPDEVIPHSGRDVQCSNCGQTWFQHHPDHEAESDESFDDASGFDEDEEVSSPLPPTPSAKIPKTEPVRKELDPAVAEILREEAEAERAARQEKMAQNTLESQPDLGLDTEQRLDDSGRRAKEAKSRMARLRGQDTSPSRPAANETEATPAAMRSRRDRLPDIEEINSTLRSSGDRDDHLNDGELDVDAPTHQRKKRWFRTGFLAILLIAVILLCLYAFAPAIIEAVPALEDWMTGYVAAVDQGRIWLNEQWRAFVEWFDIAASGTSS